MKPGSILVFVVSALLAGSAVKAETITNDAGWTVRVDGSSGDFQIEVKNPTWTIGGTTGSALRAIKTAERSDPVGAYSEITFRWREEGERSGSIRLYRSRPLVIFGETFSEGVDHSPKPFPVFSKLPANLLEFRYGEKDHLRPLSFHLGGLPADEPYGGPFALFDDEANTLIVSPASDFMIAMLSGDQKEGIRSGFNSTLKSVPAGYKYQTLLAAGPGINKTWDAWGEGLTDLYGKKRPANDADTGLKYLGYWTDNGASYYYNYDVDKGYAGTLLAVKDYLLQHGIPIHYLQLDSWWYPKTFTSLQPEAAGKPRSKNPKIPAGTWNRYGGLLEYTGHPFLFPRGLGDFQKKMGMPLITHNRWIDPESPYRAQFKVSGIAGVDPKWWNQIISQIAAWGVVTYEQDWNNYIYRRSPDLCSTTWAGDAYMDGMANACAANGLTMQYCMVLPRHLMQGGAKYSNLTTVRVSGDRLEKGKWREFLYGSRMAASLGVWPWTDVFRSKETPNILIATLSGGMVGLADAMGEEDRANIMRAARADGVIVKPDVPMTPIDQSFIADAKGESGPLVCATRTGEGDNLAAYVFASKEKGTGDWAITPASLGFSGNVIVYDYFLKQGTETTADQVFHGHLNKDGWDYTVIVPIGPSGMALIGDTGKFVTRGKKRISSIRDNAGGLQTTILALPTDQKIPIALYAPAKPVVQVKNGSCDEVIYDAVTKIARAEITVDPAALPAKVEGDSVIQIEATFRIP